MFLEAGLLTRRSVRQYQTDREVSQQDVDDLLKIAMYAPSGHNAQPWEFIVLRDEKIRHKVAEIHPYAPFIKEAPLAVVVCGNTEEEYQPGFWITDTSAAVENLLLGCHGRGLGSCWCGIYPNEERMAAFQKLLDLPAHIKPNALVVIGYPKKIPPMPKDRFKTAKIHYEKW